MKEPSFKMILTAVGDYAYKRVEDGIRSAYRLPSTIKSNLIINKYRLIKYRLTYFN